MNGPTDHDLMSMFRSGDPGAFPLLVRRWEGHVIRLLRRLSAPEPIEDLGQEVFIRVFRSQHSYRQEASFATWLYRITVNVARDRHRSLVRIRNTESRSSPRLLEDHSENPHEILTKAETEEIVQDSLRALPPKLREPLVLRHFAGITFREVADVLGTSEATVKDRVGKGLEALGHECRRRGLRDADS